VTALTYPIGRKKIRCRPVLKLFDRRQDRAMIANAVRGGTPPEIPRRAHPMPARRSVDAAPARPSQRRRFARRPVAASTLRPPAHRNVDASAAGGPASCRFRV
jgi:hypothetical protein